MTRMNGVAHSLFENGFEWFSSSYLISAFSEKFFQFLISDFYGHARQQPWYRYYKKFGRYLELSRELNNLTY